MNEVEINKIKHNGIIAELLAQRNKLLWEIKQVVDEAYKLDADVLCCTSKIHGLCSDAEDLQREILKEKAK